MRVTPPTWEQPVARPSALPLEPRPAPGRVAFALAVVMMLIATGVVSTWVLLTSDSFAGGAAALDGPLAPAGVAESEPIEIGDGARILFNAQLSQPRDPFRPLISEDSPTAGVPGVGGEFGPGVGDDGQPIDGNGFAPDANAVALVEVRDVDGVLRATVTVGGSTFDVGVGDTFADIYKVVSLSEDSGVFLKGDSVFDLAVGQQILK